MRLFIFSVSSNDLQKIKKTVDNLYTEKQKIEKEKNKKGKGKTKAKLRMEEDNVSEISNENITQIWGCFNNNCISCFVAGKY